LLFGTDKGIFIKDPKLGIKNIGVRQGLTDDKVRVLFEDKDGMIWIGTMKNIYYLQGDTAVSFNEKYNIPDAPITSIIQDSTGRILASTYDFGIFVIGNAVNSNVINPINKSSGLLQRSHPVQLPRQKSKPVAWNLHRP